MSPHTRRQLLRRAAGVSLAGALAGCPGASDGSGTESPLPAEGPRRGPDSVVAPEHRMLRDASDRPVVWVAEDADGPTATRPGPDEHHGGELVASEAAADALAFADVDGAAEARQFVENTDFDRASVYLEHEYVEACYTLDLCRASWADGIDTSYGRVLRDHDVACEADSRDTVAVLVRLPVTLDPDETRRRGTSISGSGCEILPPERGGPSPESRRGTTGEATDSASTGEGER